VPTGLRGVRPFRYHRIIAKATPVRIGQKYFQPLVNDYQRRKALKAQAQTFLLGLLILVAVLAVGFILFQIHCKGGDSDGMGAVCSLAVLKDSLRSASARLESEEEITLQHRQGIFPISNQEVPKSTRL